MDLSEAGLVILSEEECAALVATRQIGRVGVTLGALPVILPVNYGVIDDDVVFATAEGTKLRAAADRAVVAFEVDDFDAVDQRGWSVLIVGRAREVGDPEELDRVRSLHLQPWAGGTRDRFIRISTEFMSGRATGRPVGSMANDRL